jgi:hypothetical protein
MGGYNRDLLDCLSESGNKGGSVISLCERSIFAHAVFLKRIFLGFLWLFSWGNILAEEGVMEGILSTKSDSWIEVVDDGGFLHRFIPVWTGKGPANGGGFDADTLDQMKELVVGNRVEVEWVHDGHLRVLSARVLMPKYPEGTFVGYLLRSSKRWIDVQNIDEGKPWRFYLPWVGGYPSEGGGYDTKILRELQIRKATDPVRFKWKYTLRPTIVSVFDKLVDTTTPFWVGKKMPEVKRIRVEKLPEEAGGMEPAGNQPANPFEQISPAKPANPFEQLPVSKPANPFEQAVGTGTQESQTNPFDSLPAKSNPFDQLEGSQEQGEEKVKNPFDGLPIPQGTPFDMLGN